MKFSHNQTRQGIMFLLFFVCFSLNFSFAKTLHLFMVIDNDPNIYAKNDKARIERLAEDIAVSTGMSLDKHYFDRSTLTSEKLRAERDAIRYDTSDVVWCYYSGHGRNYDGRWPGFALSSGDAGIQLNKLHEGFKRKGARLTITTFDCCNYGSSIDLLFCNLLIIRIIINKYFGIKFDT